MTEEEHKAAILAIGEAFKLLPDLKSQIDVLASLTGFLMDRPKNRLAKDWLFQAEGNLRASAILIQALDEGGEKI